MRGHVRPNGLHREEPAQATFRGVELFTSEASGKSRETIQRSRVLSRRARCVEKTIVHMVNQKNRERADLLEKRRHRSVGWYAERPHPLGVHLLDLREERLAVSLQPGFVQCSYRAHQICDWTAFPHFNELPEEILTDAPGWNALVRRREGLPHLLDR